MVTSQVSDVKFTMNYDTDSTFSFSNFVSDVTDDQLYSVAMAMNSIQTEQAKTIKKIVTSELMYV